MKHVYTDGPIIHALIGFIIKNSLNVSYID